MKSYDNNDKGNYLATYFSTDLFRPLEISASKFKYAVKYYHEFG